VPTLSFNILLEATPYKPTIEQIKELQSECLKLPQVELTPTHYFADGIYGRELTIPKGLVVVGKIHRHEHLITLLKGEATIYTNEGMVRIKAPHTWVSKPGTKRALYTHKKCSFMAFHLNPTNTKDVEVLEQDIIIPEDDEQAYLEATKWFGQSQQ
jgi:quercetin dioxygenase-like cupin family protein